MGMVEIRIIKSYCGITEDVEAYIQWYNDSEIWVWDTNDLLVQLHIGSRSFIVLCKHWDAFKADKTKPLYVTELYGLIPAKNKENVSL